VRETVPNLAEIDKEKAMSRIIRYFLLFFAVFTLVGNLNLLAQDKQEKNIGLGKISITIEPFQYSERSDVEKYGVYWENAAYHHPKGLGDVSEYGFRMFTREWVKKTYENPLAKAGIIVESLILFPRANSEAEVTKYLQEGGDVRSVQVSFGRTGSTVLAVPSGEYYLDYYIIFTTGQVFTPEFKNGARESAKFLWGPSKIFVSPGQTISLTIKPCWMNVYGAPETNFCTTNSYLNDLIKEIMQNSKE